MGPFPIVCPSCSAHYGEEVWTDLSLAGIAFGKNGQPDRELKACTCGRMLLGQEVGVSAASRARRAERERKRK